MNEYRKEVLQLFQKQGYLSGKELCGLKEEYFNIDLKYVRI